MKRIFLVEDELALMNLIIPYLKEAGYEVTSFSDGLKAKEAIKKEPDVWVLDIMLPGIDGYSLIREIKEHNPDIPVIFMSARNAELDRVIGLEMGSDDYLPKPFLPRELVLRVNRLLKDKTQVLTEKMVEFDGCLFNIDKRLLQVDTEIHPLSVKEFDLLMYMYNQKNAAISRNDILDHVWGKDYFGSDRVIDDTLRRIRKKAPSLPIETVYGYGYILKVEA